MYPGLSTRPQTRCMMGRPRVPIDFAIKRTLVRPGPLAPIMLKCLVLNSGASEVSILTLYLP